MRLILRTTLVVLIAVLATSGYSAAQQFLDDQVQLLQPGLSSSVFRTYGMDASGGIEGNFGENKSGTDATGGLYQIEIETIPNIMNIYRVERRTSFNADFIVEIEGKVAVCLWSGTECAPGCGAADLYQHTWVFNLDIDPINGYLYLYMRSMLRCSGRLDEDLYGIVKIEGLPTVFDILDSYEPPSTLTFNIPLRPEGLDLAAVDSFDVYAGDLATVSDLSQAQPIACNTAIDAEAGDRISIVDPLPDPLVGNPRYYLTTVSSGAITRAGRERPDAVLVGRDGASLPPCVP